MNRRQSLSAVIIGVSIICLAITAQAAEPTKLYVDTLRIVDENGPEKPQLTTPLIALLKTRGYKVLEQKPGEPLDAEAYRLTKVVLLQSTFNPPSLGSSGSSDMVVQGTLISPTQVTSKFGPFSTHTNFEQGEFVGNDVTPKGARRALTEAFVPLANAVDKLTP